MKKTIIKVLDTMKVIDIAKTSVEPATWHYLNNFFITYRDEKLKEHLINIHDSVEQIDKYKSVHGDNNAMILNDITQLQTLANKNNAAYVRFI